MCLEAGIWASESGFGLEAGIFGLEAEIWPLKREIRPQGWDWASWLALREAQKKKEEMEKTLPHMCESKGINLFPAAAHKEKKEQGRIHGNPVADGWAGAVM